MVAPSFVLGDGRNGRAPGRAVVALDAGRLDAGRCCEVHVALRRHSNLATRRMQKDISWLVACDRFRKEPPRDTYALTICH